MSGKLTAEQVGDEIIRMVREMTVGGNDGGDSAALTIHAAYLHGFRRLVNVRRLASHRAGAEAMILARSLLSLVARAAYVDAPTDSKERRRRWEQFKLQSLRDQLKTAHALQAAGFDVDEDTQAMKDGIADLEAAGEIPNDTALLRDHLNLAAFHARLYRPASDYVHFSFEAAHTDLRSAEVIDMDAGDADLASDALQLAILTFGVLLERSERAVRHGLTGRVLALTRRNF